MIELPVIDAAEVSRERPRERFWRSISQLSRDPAYRDFLTSEFLPGASNTPGTSSRRQFLQLMGASMAMAGLTACRKPVEMILPYSRKPEEIIPGIPLSYATAMPFRGVVHGLLVESHEGRPVKIEGTRSIRSARAHRAFSSRLRCSTCTTRTDQPSYSATATGRRGTTLCHSRARCRASDLR